MPREGQIARALITAHAAEDRHAMSAAMADLTHDNLMPVLGALTAMAGNLLSLVAQMWGVESSEAWAMITQVEREMGLDRPRSERADD